MLAYRMTLEIKKRKQVKAEVRIKRWKLKTVAQSSGDRLWMPGKRKDRRNSEEHRQGGFGVSFGERNVDKVTQGEVQESIQKKRLTK